MLSSKFTFLSVVYPLPLSLKRTGTSSETEKLEICAITIHIFFDYVHINIKFKGLTKTVNNMTWNIGFFC